MARLHSSGFEWGDDQAETFGTGAGATYVGSPVRSGSLSGQVTNLTGWIDLAGGLGVTFYFRGYLYWPSSNAFPASRAQLIYLGPGGTDSAGMYMENATGNLSVRYGTSGTTLVGTSSLPLATDQWVRLELAAQINTGNDYIEGRIDGTPFASSSTATISDLASYLAEASFGPGGAVGNSWDDVAVNDSSGTNQNSWPGAGKIVLLLPASDNAVGAGWTLGTGTAIAANGFDSVNNTPPTGVADLAVGSDPKQIRNASSNANTNYDANLTSYATAGISAIDLINLVVPVVATAAPVVTSAKAGTIGMVSNPAITNVALGAAGTAGAFWKGAAGSTFPTGWKVSLGTTTYTPSVSVATAPVARITQVTSSTRIAVVCALGLYVDYLPGGLAPPPPVHIPFMR